MCVIRFIVLNIVYGLIAYQPMANNNEISAEAVTPWNAIDEVQTFKTVTPRTLRTYKTIATGDMVRRTTTKPHVVDKTCLLKPDEGPCRAMIEMWYFDPAAMSCSTFTWGGCQGNGNRFDSAAACNQTCLSQPGWKERRPRYCFLNFDYGWCFGADERWYYDRRWGVCKKTIYSGCGGNKNNFYNKEKCDDVCRLGSFFLTPHKKEEENIKKILIINPAILTDPTENYEGPKPTEPTVKSMR